MSKKEFLEILAKELKRLEEVEHVSDLANNGRYAEVDAIVVDIDYSALNEYMEQCDGDGDLEVSEIPGAKYLAFAIYLSGSDYDECDVMAYWQDLQNVLLDCGEAGSKIYSTMSCDCINAFDTFEKLLNCEYDQNDEDDEESDDDEEYDEEDEEDEEESDEGGEE